LFRLISKNYSQIIYNPKYYNVYHQVSFAVLLKTKFSFTLDSAVFKLQINRIRIRSVTTKLTLTAAVDKLGLKSQAPFIKIYSNPSLTTEVDHAIAQAVSRWLPTAVAQVRAQVRSCGICVGQGGTGAGFL
jgi:hypothetical protein